MEEEQSFSSGSDVVEKEKEKKRKELSREELERAFGPGVGGLLSSDSEEEALEVGPLRLGKIKKKTKKDLVEKEKEKELKRKKLRIKKPKKFPAVELLGGGAEENAEGVPVRDLETRREEVTILTRLLALFASSTRILLELVPRREPTRVVGQPLLDDRSRMIGPLLLLPPLNATATLSPTEPSTTTRPITLSMERLRPHLVPSPQLILVASGLLHRHPLPLVKAVNSLFAPSTPPSRTPTPIRTPHPPQSTSQLSTRSASACSVG